MRVVGCDVIQVRTQPLQPDDMQFSHNFGLSGCRRRSLQSTERACDAKIIESVSQEIVCYTGTRDGVGCMVLSEGVSPPVPSVALQ